MRACGRWSSKRLSSTLYGATLKDAVATVIGTPYESVEALPVEGQQGERSLFTQRLTQSPDGTVTIRTTIHVALGVKWPP
jgi:hypothetical protein